MPTPSDPLYPQIPSGYAKNPYAYNDCPLCGAIKGKYAKCCWGCRRSYRPPMDQPSDPSYRFIPLTQDQYAIVDTTNYDYLIQWKWSARWSKEMKSFYAIRSDRTTGRNITVLMHREILGLKYGDPRDGDHGLHNTLDNRRFVDGKENLRIATRSENLYNQSPHSKNISGYRGVYWFKPMKKWSAMIIYERKRVFLGYFKDKEEAYAARRQAEKKYYGRFSCEE